MDKYVDDHLFNKIFGFELMMAPYVIAHLKLGMALAELATQENTNKRLGVYH